MLGSTSSRTNGDHIHQSLFPPSCYLNSFVNPNVFLAFFLCTNKGTYRVLVSENCNKILKKV